MAGKPSLRVATAADAAPPKILTLSEAIESGTYLEILKAQRRQMVSDLSDASGPALAALHRQIALHSKEIAGLEIAAAHERDGARNAAEVEDGKFDASAV